MVVDTAAAHCLAVKNIPTEYAAIEEIIGATLMHSVVIRLRPGHSMNLGSIPGGSKKFFSSPKR
jgi:hypothetical protein